MSCILFLTILYFSLPLVGFICASVLIFLSLFIFLKQNRQVIQLDYLEHDQWSVMYADSAQIYRMKLVKMINHELYIVCHFQHNTPVTILIWRDQMSKKQWKSLKVRANLG